MNLLSSTGTQIVRTMDAQKTKAPKIRSEHVVAGTQIITTMSTQSPDGNAARLLREVAKSCKRVRISRLFPENWEIREGFSVICGTIKFQGREFPLTIKIGLVDLSNTEELILVDVPGKNSSMQPVDEGMMLQVGDNLTSKRIESLASQIVGSWVVHGKNWLDRVGELFRRPWGNTKNDIPDKFFFEIIDGANETNLTLADLIGRGCNRSTHVGEWCGRHSTIIPAIIGMNMTFHEFKAAGGDDICRFKGLPISSDKNFWGPYCLWNESVRQSGQLGKWQELALSCISPFSFQVHATRVLFPQIQLDSDYLLQKVGAEKLWAIFSTMAMHQPERFYRIIDHRGIAHRQTGISDDYLRYGNNITILRKDVANNAVATFLELQNIQNDPSYVIERKPRVVIDSHAYIVIEALARRLPETHELSGRDMHAYLTMGSDAKMHRIRNEELFLLLRDFFGMKSMKFHVYPPLMWDSGLISQYDDSLNQFNKEEWLLRKVK